MRCDSSPNSWIPPWPAHIGKTQNHSGYVSIAQPYAQKLSATANANTAHGRCSSAYSRCRHEEPLRNIAPVQASTPRSRGRNGSGSPTSRPSRARARARSSVPKPRQVASVAASSGTPTKVTSRPAPSDTIVTASVNMMMLSGRLSMRYENSRRLRPSNGARSPAGSRCRRSRSPEPCPYPAPYPCPGPCSYPAP